MYHICESADCLTRIVLNVVFIFNFNLLKPSGFVTYHQV